MRKEVISDHKEYRALMLEKEVKERVLKAKPAGVTLSNFISSLLSK